MGASVEVGVAVWAPTDGTADFAACSGLGTMGVGPWAVDPSEVVRVEAFGAVEAEEACVEGSQ